MGVRRVPELLDERMTVERLLDDAALDSLAAAMDQANLVEARCMGGGDVLLHDGPDVAGGEGVQIERSFDGDPVGHANGNSQLPNSQLPMRWALGVTSRRRTTP